jgi:hypothetical protein
MAIRKIVIRPPGGAYADELHPKTSAEQVVEDTTKRFVTDAEKTTWNGKSTLALGSTSVTAHRGDQGATAYTHSQAAHAPSTADQTSAVNVGASIHGATAKTPPIDADTMPLIDSAASNVLKKVTWLNIKATLKTYFDTLYNLYTHPANHPPAIITQDTTNRFVTDAEKTTWNGKQNALGYTPLDSTLKGAVNGLAELDSGGKVPSSQLPSYVDDVLEYANLAGFPGTGETGKIYIAIDTEKTYRWGGSAYSVISETIAIGETSATAYRGDRGKTAYDHSQVAHAPAGADATTAVNVGTSIHGATAKTTLADADTMPLIDSAASNVLKKITVANLKVQVNGAITKAQIEAKLTGAIDTHSHASGTPTAHAATHASGGGDAITPTAIGAAAAAHNHVMANITDLNFVTIGATQPTDGSLWFQEI